MQSENSKDAQVSTESWKQIWSWSKIEIRSVLSYRNDLDRNKVWIMILSGWGWIQAATFSLQFCPFRTESVLNKRSSLNSVLTSNGSDLGKMHHTKVVNDFDTFHASIIMPSSEKWSRSNDLWKSGGAAGNFSFLDRLPRTNIFSVESSSWRKPSKLQMPQT
jgi:hypothetical protein